MSSKANPPAEIKTQLWDNCEEKYHEENSENLAEKLRFQAV